MTERKPLHDCSFCICGQIEFSWSDRTTHAFQDDYPALAQIIMSCAFDGVSDREDDGIPWGFTDAQREACAPIVDRYVAQNWRTVAVHELSDEQRTAMRNELEEALRRVGT